MATTVIRITDQQTGIANLPLHRGKAPACLFYIKGGIAWVDDSPPHGMTPSI